MVGVDPTAFLEVSTSPALSLLCEASSGPVQQSPALHYRPSRPRPCFWISRDIYLCPGAPPRIVLGTLQCLGPEACPTGFIWLFSPGGLVSWDSSNKFLQIG